MSVSDGPHTGMPVLLRVHVEDLNDNWPQFEHSVYNVTVTEVESRVKKQQSTIESCQSHMYAREFLG